MIKQNKPVMTSSAMKAVLLILSIKASPAGQFWTVKYGGNSCPASANIACHPAVTLALTSLNQMGHCWREDREFARGIRLYLRAFIWHKGTSI